MKKKYEGLDDKRVRQNREFFNTSPEQAKAILEIAEVVENVTPTEDVVETPQDKQDYNARKEVEELITLESWVSGTTLTFSKDQNITLK